MLAFSQVVSVNHLPVTSPGLFDWHIEVPASPRNQKIGFPEGLPQFPDLHV
jgi:hypothetical protein